MLLTDQQIELLLKQKAITDEWPWETNAESIVDKHIKQIVAELRKKLRLKEKSEYGHYGSGYASFVDCWLYRDDDHFRSRPGNHYHGLVILFSRFSPYYVLGEGEKSWHESGGASYLPDFEFVDKIEHQAVTELVPQVVTILDKFGLVQLHKPDLEPILPRRVRVPTILADKVHRHFDALFYWED